MRHTGLVMSRAHRFLMTRNNAKAKHRRLQACARLSPAGFAARASGEEVICGTARPSRSS